MNVVVLWEGKTVLVRRGTEPYKGSWALPGGFVTYGEEPAAAAAREVREETGLDISVDSLVAATIVRDDPRALLLVLAYLGRVTGGMLRAGDDAAEARAFSADELPLIQSACDRCQLEAALERWTTETGT